MEWLVKNAVNRDVERQHLNKILQDIKAAMGSISKELAAVRDASAQQDIQSIVGAMVANNSERGLAVSYNPQKKTLDFRANDFIISLLGDVTGQATVDSLNNVTIDTQIGDGLIAPSDGEFYWQHNGEWEVVLPPISGLQYIDTDGFLVRVTGEDGTGYATRLIEGVADQIDVEDGEAQLGNPVISLANLADVGGGTFKLILRDAKGRLLGTSDGTTDDVPEGLINLYFPEAPIDGESYTRKDGAWVVGGGSSTGGVLPVVTGEVPPVLVYFDDGSLMYAPVE